MTISATTVRELREKTNAGMMDCKKALEETSGNMEQAIELLRKKGLSIAAKKASRTANEGILGYYYNEKEGLSCLVEVNCETDFVVKTAEFQNFVKQATDLVKTKNPKDLSALLQYVEATLTALVAKIGENIQVKQFVRWETKPESKVGFYLHAGSKIGVLVSVADPENKVSPAAVKEIAMHVAAMHPQYVRPEEVPPAVVEKEKEVLRATVDPKKPPQVQDKILEGKLGKFFNDICLENQIFVKDPEGKRSIKAWLGNMAPKAKIEKFVRIQVGHETKI